jgi:fructose/tagatose bisphosphate aldolase
VHIIYSHLYQVISKTGQTLYTTNTEGLESIHSALKAAEKRYSILIINFTGSSHLFMIDTTPSSDIIREVTPISCRPGEAWVTSMPGHWVSFVD